MINHFRFKKGSALRFRRFFSWRIVRRIVIAGLLAGVVFASGIVGLRAYTALRYRGDVYTLKRVPYHHVAIIFGAWVHPDGSPSEVLADRVAMGAALIRSGKADILLLSGDNRFVYYDEPEAMRRYALQLGVPDSALVLDYAGRRTYDTCYRAKAIFKVDDAILVTQNFHLDRALLLCNGLGVQSVGVAADVLRPQGYGVQLFRWEVREFPATVLAVSDLLRRPKPVLGDPLPIAREP